MVETVLVGTTLLYFFGLGVLSFYLVEQERRPYDEERSREAANTTL
jgi:hypothetical protein